MSPISSKGKLFVTHEAIESRGFVTSLIRRGDLSDPSDSKRSRRRFASPGAVKFIPVCCSPLLPLLPISLRDLIFYLPNRRRESRING